MRTRRIRIVLLSLVHAVWMVALTFFLLETDWMQGDEAWLIKNTAAVQRLLLPEPDKPDPKEFAFVNVAWDKILVDRIDADGFPAGKRPIVDRVRLTQLLQHLRQDPVHKFLLCDIVFFDESPADSLLTTVLDGFPRAAFSAYRGDSSQPMPSVVPVPAIGLVEYKEVNDDFLKFRLVRDTFKSMPVKLFEMIDGGNFERGSLLSWRNGQLAQNDFVLDLRLRQHDLMRPDRVYAYADLHTLTDLIEIGQGSQVSDFLRDRIVIVGDFEDRDMHKTIFGDMAGPLILLNIYIALREGDNLVPMGFFGYLLAVYFLVTLGLFKGNDWLESLVMRLVGGNSIVWILLLQGAVYTLLFACVSVLSFALFKIHINFLAIALYFQLWEWGKMILKARREQKARLAE